MRYIATSPTDKLVNVLIRDTIAKLIELCCYGAFNCALRVFSYMFAGKF